MSVVNNLVSTLPPSGNVANDLSEDDLKLLNASAALTLDEEKVPVKLGVKLGLRSENEACNIISGLIADSSSDQLKNLSVANLREGFPVLRKPHDELDHLVRAPEKFGNKPLTKELLDQVRSTPKNAREAAHIEYILNSAKEIHAKNNSELSPKAFATLLEGMLPKNMLDTYYNVLSKEQFTITELFEDLGTIHGSLKPLPLLISDMHNITDNYVSIWDLVEKLYNLLSKSGKNFSTVSDLCIYEVLHKIEKDFGITLAGQVKNSLDSDPRRKDFRSLYSLIKNRYLSHFKKPSSRRHSNHIKSVVHNINQGQDRSPDISNATCYFCRGRGHFARACPQKANSFNRNNQFSRNNNVNSNNRSTPYFNAPCALHGPGHKNSQCKAQKNPCTFKDSHKGHSECDCKRPSHLTNPKLQKPKPSFAPKPSSSGRAEMNHIEVITVPEDSNESSED